MSSSNPIIPPGSPLQRPQPRINSRLLVTVCALLAVHLFILAGLLIQGCQRQDNPGSASAAATNDLPPLIPPSGSTTTPVREEMKPTDSAPMTVANADRRSAEPAPIPPTTMTTPRSEEVTSKPAVIEPAPVLANPDAPMSVYVVKVGDTLTKVAKNHHTSIKAIRAANNLKTDRILLGQKLKVPQGSAPTDASSPAVPSKSSAERHTAPMPGR